MDKLLVLIINDMVIFPNNEVRIEYDNNYDKQMAEIVDRIDDNLMLIVNPIDEANIVNLRNVIKELKIGSLKKRFDRIWNKSHIKNTTVPKKTCYKILQRAIDGADIEELNFDIREKFFNKKFGIE